MIIYSPVHSDTLEWRGVSVNGPPPPARLDHAMCSVLIPVASGGTAEVASTGKLNCEYLDTVKQRRTIVSSEILLLPQCNASLESFFVILHVRTFICTCIRIFWRS